MMRHRVNLLDTWIDRVSASDAGERIDGFVQSGSPHQIVPANVDFLRLGCADATFRALVNSSDLVVADGMPLVWAARLQGDALPHRISGVDLIHECGHVADAKGYSVFLLGAAPGVADDAAMVLKARYPGVQIAGTYAPPPLPLSPAEDYATVQRIRLARPDILLVAFGAPQQELWIRAHRDELGVSVCIGVGGAFDMLTGRVRRAPIWMQRSGLEWLFRLMQEPGRLWKRYFIHDLPVFVRLMTQPGRGAAQAGPAEPTPNWQIEPLAAFDRVCVQTVEPYALEESGSSIA